ncbi:hypothetical protein [Kocuria sp. CPCC 205263]|uniref:hypothetical protein n=1 Tax=Kocuria sp. CPCC 205263 TaxID=3073555 RepID=UPI0034D5E011
MTVKTTLMRALLVAPTASALTVCGLTGAIAASPMADATAPFTLVMATVASSHPDAVAGNGPERANGGQGNGGLGNGGQGSDGTIPGNGHNGNGTQGNGTQGNGGLGNGGQGSDGAIPGNGNDGNGTQGNGGLGNGGQGSDGAIPGNGNDGNGTQGNGGLGNGGQGSDGAIPGNGNDGNGTQGNGGLGNGGQGSDGAIPGNGNDGNGTQGNGHREDEESTPVPTADPLPRHLAPQDKPSPQGSGDSTAEDSTFQEGPATVLPPSRVGSADTPLQVLPATAVVHPQALLRTTEITTITNEVRSDASTASVVGAGIGPSAGAAPEVAVALPESLAYTGVSGALLGVGGLGAVLLAAGAVLRRRCG